VGGYDEEEEEKMQWVRLGLQRTEEFWKFFEGPSPN